MMTDQSQPQPYYPHPQEANVPPVPATPNNYAEAYTPPQPVEIPVTQAPFTPRPAAVAPETAPVESIASNQPPTADEDVNEEDEIPPLAPGQNNRFPGYLKPPKEETVLEWDALSRPFKQRSRQYFSTLMIIVILVSLILFFAGQFIPIAVVIAVAFLAYVLSVIPPTMVRHRITTFGLRVEDNLYYWEELGRFWFTEKFGQPLLHIEVARFPGRLTLLLGQETLDDMRDVFSEVLLEEKPVATFFEKAATWLEEKVPLESSAKP